MGLKTDYNPYEAFVTKGRTFIESPGVISGIEFDDAIVAYKRFVLSQLHDESQALKLNELGKCVRAQDVDRVSTLFDEIVAAAGQPD